MLTTRVIPSLLLSNSALVKTINFRNPFYIGDPINTVRIFNQLEVDELIFLDIYASKENKVPDFELIENIAGECFMPFAYGGGINSIEIAKRVINLGVEKVSVNTAATENQNFIRHLADSFGSQSIIVSIDIKKSLLGKYELYNKVTNITKKFDLLEFIELMQKNGAGEIFLNSVDRDGTWKGYDLELIKKISSAVDIPVIACGGAGNINDFKLAINEGGASAVSAGSMFIYQKKDLGVLVSYPTQTELKSYQII